MKAIDRSNYEQQLESYSPKAFVQQFKYLGAKINKIIEWINAHEEIHTKEYSQDAEKDIKLAPCPFCGCDAVIKQYTQYTGTELWMIEGEHESKCLYYGRECFAPQSYNKQELIDKWNKRATDEAD